MYHASVSNDGQELRLQTEGLVIRYHAIWLRDNAPDAGTRSPANGQRLITLNDIPNNVSIRNVKVRNDQLDIEFLPKGERIAFSLPWLLEHRYDRSSTTPDAVDGLLSASLVSWDAKIQREVPQADFASVAGSSDALEQWLHQLATYGFAKLNNGPVEELALMKVASLFGYVRETNYGKHFEVRTEVNASNLAFTGLGLQAHTDNPYRDPAPTMQILYCLESSAAGGENMVVDGFRVAMRLRDENKDYFDVLSQYSANFKYEGEEGVCLKATRPMIELGPSGELLSIRFNNRSASAFTEIPFEKMPLYYAAYRRMSEIIDDPSMQVSFRLAPGECFIVDNTRVLHARKSYSGTGTRWLQGCYVDKDGLQSTLSSLENRRIKSKTVAGDGAVAGASV